MNMLIRRSLLLLLFILPLLSQLEAQNYVEIGTGTVANTMPIYSYWNYSWSSLIYNHADLGAAKSITKIALNCTNGPKTVTNQKIYYKLTSNTIFANANYEDPLNNGYTLIYSGDLSFVNGWNEITLLTPIPYDGIQNLAMHWEDRWGNSYGPVFNATTSSINNNKNCGNDSFFPLPTQTGYLNPYPSALPNMRFFYAGSGPATPTNPIPADNATVVSVSTSLSWVLGANTTSYDLYFGTNPQNLPLVVSNAPASAGTYTYTPPTMLADSTMHYWKVVAKNGGQQEVSPVWKFKTEVVIDQFPYHEGFEDSLVFHTYPVVSAWVIDPDISWYQYDTIQHSGLLCAKTSWYTYGNQASMRSPKVLLPPNYSISYFWRNTNANKVEGHDTTYFEITTNGGLSWLKLDTLSPATVNAAYVQRTINLNSYAGNNFYFRYRHVTDLTGSACNVYLDDISIFQSSSTPSLVVTPPNQNVTSSSGSTQFSVASNSAWTVSSDQSWCTVSPSGNGNGIITANYTGNTSGSPRVAHITVTVAGISPVVVTVTQSATGSVLTVDPMNQNVSAPAGSTSFSVTTTDAWTAASNQAWCVVTLSGTGNGTITANYTENTTGAQRVANITVTVTGLTPVIVTVTQSAAATTLSVSPPNQNVASAAGNTAFTVTSNAAWTAASNQAWCTVNPTGSGNGTITATFTENTSGAQRIANITVTVSGLSPVVVTVTQNAANATLSVSPLNQDVTSDAGNTSFTVTSNSAWTAASNQSWCTVTPSGTGNGAITATYTENTALVSRVATITVTVAGLSPVNVTVTQEASLPFLGVTPSNQDVSYQGGTTNFTVNSNIGWSAVSDAGWCAVTSSGSGIGTLFATYAENNIAATRIAHITVTASGLSPVIVTVTQSGPAAVLGVTPVVQNVTYLTGLTTFAVTTNASWTAGSDAAWCVPTASGTGSGVLMAVYEQNTSLVTRTAHISVNASSISPVIVQVIQQPSTVGIPDENKNEVIVSPNPSNGMISIETGEKTFSNATLVVLNIEGKVVYSQSYSSSKEKLDLSRMAKGIYILRILSDNSVLTTRFIIQ